MINYTTNGHENLAAPATNLHFQVGIRPNAHSGPRNVFHKLGSIVEVYCRIRVLVAGPAQATISLCMYMSIAQSGSYGESPVHAHVPAWLRTRPYPALQGNGRFLCVTHATNHLQFRDCMCRYDDLVCRRPSSYIVQVLRHSDAG